MGRSWPTAPSRPRFERNEGRACDPGSGGEFVIGESAFVTKTAKSESQGLEIRWRWQVGGIGHHR